MKSSKIFYSLMIAAIAAAFGAGYSLKKVSTVFVDVPRTQVDTLYVEVERVVQSGRSEVRVPRLNGPLM